MSLIKYLLDEHIPHRLRKGLKQRIPDLVVRRIGDVDAPPIGTLDPDILRWCETSGFLLITNNRASMPVHLQEHFTHGRHIPGIFLLSNQMTLSQTIEELILVWEVAEAEEYFDQIRYLPVSN